MKRFKTEISISPGNRQRVKMTCAQRCSSSWTARWAWSMAASVSALAPASKLAMKILPKGSLILAATDYDPADEYSMDFKQSLLPGRGALSGWRRKIRKVHSRFCQASMQVLQESRQSLVAGDYVAILRAQVRKA